jgi:multidrug efflux pump subunit AcrB
MGKRLRIKWGIAAPGYRYFSSFLGDAGHGMAWWTSRILLCAIDLALTLFSYYMLDYTLNRITLFALVFVGIVVDDSIIAENMHRHFKMKRLPFKQAAIYAINEVGTILATFTVIAAILPMAFVSGMMGPYMSPMPIGASIAMILSCSWL